MNAKHIFFIVFAINIVNSQTNECINDCYNNGDCIWVHRSRGGERGFNSTIFKCDCYKKYTGKYCNITSKDPDYEEEIKEEEGKEEALADEVKNMSTQFTIAMIFSYVFGVLGLIICIVQLGFWVMKKRRQKLQDVYNLSGLDTSNSESVYKEFSGEPVDKKKNKNRQTVLNATNNL
jgi:hypothetical protein